jgi:hypothetical protein
MPQLKKLISFDTESRASENNESKLGIQKCYSASFWLKVYEYVVGL